MRTLLDIPLHVDPVGNGVHLDVLVEADPAERVEATAKEGISESRALHGGSRSRRVPRRCIVADEPHLDVDVYKRRDKRGLWKGKLAERRERQCRILRGESIREDLMMSGVVALVRIGECDALHAGCKGIDFTFRHTRMPGDRAVVRPSALADRAII